MRIIKVDTTSGLHINLDNFDRSQEISRVYIKRDGGYVLEEQPGIMDWNLDKKRVVAKDLEDSSYISYLALEGDKVIGFVSLMKELQGERMIFDVIQVDRAYRHRGIGRMLWEKAAAEARMCGAKELYISACPAEETIAFYSAMGADITDAPITSIAEEESDDLQMVYVV